MDKYTSRNPELAKRAGVAEGTIYRHFASKQQLLNDLYGGAATWASNAATGVLDPKVPAREQLALLADQLLTGAEASPATVKLFFLQPLDGLLDGPSREARQAFADAVIRIVAIGKSEGSIRVGAAEVSAAVWLSVVRLALERVGAGDWRRREDPQVQQTVTSAWNAIATSTDSPT